MEIIGQLLQPIGTLFHYVFYEPVDNVLMLVYMLVHNFALAIIILTILIRVALIPLTRAQLKSQQEMQRLQPELKRIQQQYRNDVMRLRQEQQALYREHGVSPAKGCLPLLIQMPFLYALYYSFFTVLRPGAQLPANCAHLVGKAAQACLINNDIYPFLPHLSAATLPQTQFLWTNLTSPDPLHILPILAGVLTFIQLRMAMPVKKPQPRGATPDATTQATSTMQYIMPFITIFIGWAFPSGLALYWCFSTGFSVVQQYFINGNFGSLFVGVPGMQHLVPPPKDLTTSTTPPALPARGAARGAGAIVPSTPQTPPEGGWRGLMKQLLAPPGASQVPAVESVDSGAGGNGAGNGEGARAKPSAGANGTSAYPRERRPRQAREGAKLVRPQPPAPGEPEPLPEDEANRAGTSMLDGKRVLPEQAIARENAANGTTGTNGANPRPGGQPNGPSRSNNASYRKGPPKRPGGGRPKGGR